LAAASPFGYAHVSNDGRQIVGFFGDRLCVMPFAGGVCRPVGDPADAPVGSASHWPYWSPDDRWIVSWGPGGDQPILIDVASGRASEVQWLTSVAHSWQRVAP